MNLPFTENLKVPNDISIGIKLVIKNILCSKVGRHSGNIVRIIFFIFAFTFPSVSLKQIMLLA